jgi:LPXTG-motif cell wall-anchored protein
MDSVYADSNTKVETTLAGKLQPGNYTVSITLDDAETNTAATGTDLPFTVEKPLATTDNTTQPRPLPQIIQDAGTGNTPYLIAAGLLAVLATLILLIRRKRNQHPHRGGTTNTTRQQARKSHTAEHDPQTLNRSDK